MKSRSAASCLRQSHMMVSGALCPEFCLTAPRRTSPGHSQIKYLGPGSGYKQKSKLGLGQLIGSPV